MVYLGLPIKKDGFSMAMSVITRWYINIPTEILVDHPDVEALEVHTEVCWGVLVTCVVETTRAGQVLIFLAFRPDMDFNHHEKTAFGSFFLDADS